MKLAAKFTLAFSLVSLIATGLAAAFIWGATSFEFNRFLQDQRQGNFQDAAMAYYQQNNSWVGVERSLQQQGLLPPPGQPGTQRPAPAFALLDSKRVVIVPGGSFQRGQSIPVDARGHEVPIVVRGGQVGIMLDTNQPLVRNTVEQQFVTRINQALLIAALGGTLIALFLGTWLARSLTRPVNELTSATRAMARGDLEQQVAVRSQDELGELALSFNQMSADLARANQARRQMTADIAHDLRNPLTVIGGYLEGLQDGVLKPSEERYKTMHGEVQHLERLVEDLRTLSLADSGEMPIHRQPAPPAELMERLSAAYQHQAAQQKVTLVVDAPADLPEINIDAERIEQVLGNLVSNALRYTSASGEIRLSAYQEVGGVTLSVQDNGSGIAPEVLPHIFERSYRGDPSRQGNESGLGLSIARSIVELHGGTINVTSAGPGQGAQFTIFFPI